MSPGQERKSRIVLRPMVEEDIQEVLSIDRAIWGGQRALTYADPVESYIAGDISLSLVAEVEDGIAGFLLARLAEPSPGMPKMAWIELIGVLPQQQHRGIGGKLVEALIDHCHGLGVSRVHVMADRDDEVLKGFFSSLSFRPGSLINYYRRIED